MAGSRQKPFNLLYSFALLSLFCIVCICVISAFLLSHFLTDNMLERDAVVTMQFVQGMAGSEDVVHYFEAHDEQVGGAGADSSLDEDEPQVPEEFFTRIATMPEVLRSNVFAADGSIIWSSRTRLVGNIQANEELEKALSGELALEVGETVDTFEQEEHLKFRGSVVDFVENYIPIWNTSKDRVVGVVEVYKVPEALFTSIARGRQLIWGSALLGGIFLYGALFWIVRRAGLLIQKQHEQLVESETLTAVGEMASAITHSIRNSLASIRSSAEVMLEGVDGQCLDEVAQDIVGQSDRMAAEIRELLAYSRPSSYNPEPLQANEVIRQGLQHYERAIAKQHIDVSVDLDESLPPFQGDAILLRHVFDSLIGNALDAMPRGGDLTIRNWMAADGRNAQIKIVDTGQGISAEQLSKVFKPFHTTKSNGLGIGLALAQRVVEQHGGKIELTSREGQGTEVVLLLPIVR